ncbi:hypothetical protein NDS46_31370 (plasmid) [Paenibacillus thiaminolyticus]|uniref:hypothetical protein n=1 Tax=Paenibacillus thiaminolyticus TaxID=49283 RepID=UPI00232E91CF|nr:hypothetical protein [Paenibacillus thiaminolyticus]WCF11459.1 hypothetical protein NDS46_31370 [Paenibacillus thiaminolyticus]
MKDFKYLLHSIYWCSESMHNGVELAKYLIDKGIAGSYSEVATFPSTCRYYKGKPQVLGLIYDIWRIFASKRVVYLELTEENFRIRPVVNPHLLVHICKSKSPVSCPGVHGATIGKQLRFNVWDGRNAPVDLYGWTGIVKHKLTPPGGPVEYVIKRDVDGELIKLTRDYLIPLG